MRTPDHNVKDDDDEDDDFGYPDEEDRDSLTDVPGGVRLQKVLAEAGIGSRRHCEEMIGPAGSRSTGRRSAGSARGSTPNTR